MNLVPGSAELLKNCVEAIKSKYQEHSLDPELIRIRQSWVAWYEKYAPKTDNVEEFLLASRHLRDVLTNPLGRREAKRHIIWDSSIKVEYISWAFNKTPKEKINPKFKYPAVLQAAEHGMFVPFSNELFGGKENMDLTQYIPAVTRGNREMKRAVANPSVQWRGNKKHDMKPLRMLGDKVNTTECPDEKTCESLHNIRVDNEYIVENIDTCTDTEGVSYEYIVVKESDSTAKSIPKFFLITLEGTSKILKIILISKFQMFVLRSMGVSFILCITTLTNLEIESLAENFSISTPLAMR